MEDIDKNNKSLYESPRIVRIYAMEKSLQLPERTILRLMKNKLPSMNMLDIGVGAGRTTHHFAHRAKEYVGIDYSANMIKECQRKFPNIHFEVADARNLTRFKDNHFHFTLFSFNGIDYMNSDDRIKTLSEITRVTKEDGYVCFSTHNANSAPELLKVRFSTAGVLLAETRRWFLCHTLNKKPMQVKNKPYLILQDGARGSKFSTCYVKPEEQIKQLGKLRFGLVRIFGIDGNEIPQQDLARAKDAWLYFLCKKLPRT